MLHKVKLYTFSITLALSFHAALAEGNICFDERSSNSARFMDCKEKADKGNVKAQVSVAYMYQIGLGVEKNNSNARKWMTTAAESGYIDGQRRLAWMYFNGVAGDKDYQKAFKWYKKAAEQGSSAAAINLAGMYRSGNGTEQDYDKSMEWYQKEAELWNPSALLQLGKMYQEGQGVSPNPLKSYIHLQTALVLEIRRHSDFGGASNEYYRYRNNIIRRLTQTQINKAKIDIYNELKEAGIQNQLPDENSFDYWFHAEMRKKEKASNNYITGALYHTAASLGNKNAQLFLIKVYQNSGRNFGREDDKAFHYYSISADQNDTESQLNLAYMHYHGKQTPQDKQKALHWYKQAAETKQGEQHTGFNTMAKYLVAWMYDTGQGIPQDYKQAFQWYQKAAEAGYGDAKLRLAELYQQGQGVEKDKQQAIQWIQTAAEQGYNKAQRILADHYRSGTLIEQDSKQAFNWYKKAAVLEDTQAQYALAQLYATGQGTDKKILNAYILSAYLANAYNHTQAKTLCQQLEKKLSQTELKQAQELGVQWQTDAKYRTLGVAVPPPFNW